MKFNLLKIAFFSVMFSAPFSHAQMDRGNGGDPDVSKFRKIGSEIQSWIQGGYANKIVLPAGISLKKYVTAMDAAFNTYHVSFVDRAVNVRGLQRMCKNTNDHTNGAQIVCQRSLILRELNANSDGIYQLIHHEVAGIAGLEVNIGQESDTRLSDQVTKKVVVNRLPIEMGKAPFVAYANSEGTLNSCVGRALNRYLRKEFNVGWETKIASYANSAHREEMYQRVCGNSVFGDWFDADYRKETVLIHPKQMAQQLPFSQIIHGYKHKYDTDPTEGVSQGCVVFEDYSPVRFNVAVKVNGEEVYDAVVTLASLDRTIEFITEKDTFYCSLNTVKLTSKKTGRVVLNQ